MCVCVCVHLNCHNTISLSLSFYDRIGSGFNTPTAVPAPSNMSSGRKPKKARRSQTVALGGINRTSKKAMLLRWCQIATDHYDVRILL